MDRHVHQQSQDLHARHQRLPTDIIPDDATSATDVKVIPQSSNNVDMASVRAGTSDPSYGVSTTHNVPNSGNSALSELSDASNDAVRDNQHVDPTTDQSEGSRDEHNDSVRSFGDISVARKSVITNSGPSSRLSSSRLQHGVPEADDIRVAGARTPYIDPSVPLGNGISQRASPSVNSYKTALGSDDVVSKNSDNTGDATGEGDLFSNVSDEDRQTLQNLAFDMGVYGTNVAKPEVEKGQLRAVTDVGAEVPQKSDGGYGGDKSAEPAEMIEDEEQTGVADGHSQKSAQQTVYAPEESIPPARDEVKMADTEIPTGGFFFTYIVN